MNQLINDVLVQFTAQITDRVFLMIQNDKNLFNRLNALTPNQQTNFKQQLGREIPKWFNLGNLDLVDATSVLIDKYTQHTK